MSNGNSLSSRFSRNVPLILLRSQIRASFIEFTITVYQIVSFGSLNQFVIESFGFQKLSHLMSFRFVDCCNIGNKHQPMDYFKSRSLNRDLQLHATVISSTSAIGLSTSKHAWMWVYSQEPYNGASRGNLMDLDMVWKWIQGSGVTRVQRKP